ncbi:unnamed protein product [Caretta caretta]
MLPNRNLATRAYSHKREGFKQRKHRVTLLFCVNKSGSHKVRPLIGKARSPRCFHHVNMKALPFEYTNSKNAWMNSSIFEDQFHKTFVPAVQAHLRKLKQEQKALFLLITARPIPQWKILSVVTARLKSLISQRTMCQKSCHWTKASYWYLSKTIIVKRSSGW